jgi:hypothetical protein
MLRSGFIHTKGIVKGCAEVSIRKSSASVLQHFPFEIMGYRTGRIVSENS